MPALSRSPFGEVSCESEREVFREDYESLFFRSSPFNLTAIDKSNYLFIGRRGCGKTSLAHFLTFQNAIPSARCIDVDEPAVLEDVLNELARRAVDVNNLSSYSISRIWEHIIWSLIFELFKEQDDTIRDACVLSTRENSPTRLLRDLVKHFINKLLGDDSGEWTDDMEACLASSSFEQGKQKILELTEASPVFVAIDTLEERHSIENVAMLRVNAALIECSANFNTRFASKGIFLKTFISAEIYPHLAENEISNTTKYIRNPVYLQWRPKDILRLASWRLHVFLASHPTANIKLPDSCDWDNYQDVRKKAWLPYFGSRITNGRNCEEDSFSYVLRHTQLRPRQFVILCNAIAENAVRDNTFPKFHNKHVVDGVRTTEKILSTEIINSYSKLYPNVGNIVRAITKFPTLFKGKQLDKIAPSTASEWPQGDYSQFRFRQVLTELGIVGRVRQLDTGKHYIEADFAYAMDDVLNIRDGDDCVIHPMFFQKLSIDRKEPWIVFRFPDHPSFDDVKAL